MKPGYDVVGSDLNLKMLQKAQEIHFVHVVNTDISREQRAKVTISCTSLPIVVG